MERLSDSFEDFLVEHARQFCYSSPSMPSFMIQFNYASRVAKHNENDTFCFKCGPVWYAITDFSESP